MIASMLARDRDRSIAALLVGGVAFLLLELRFEHREVLGEEWQSWIPLLYCAMTLGTGALALRSWDGWGRRVLAGLFLVGIAVGVAGFCGLGALGWIVSTRRPA